MTFTLDMSELMSQVRMSLAGLNPLFLLCASFVIGGAVLSWTVGIFGRVRR